MTNFSRDALAAVVKDPEYRMKVVMIEEIPDDLEHPISTYHLDLSDELEAQFKENVARSIERWPHEGYWEHYVEGWVPEQGQFATAGMEILEGSRLKQAIDEGLSPGRVRMPELGQTGLPHARGYALVLARAGNTLPSEQVYLIRRLDPIQHLERGRVTALWSETRLSLARAVVAFDSSVDVAVWRDSVVIRSLSALEALFFPGSVHAEAAKRAVTELNTRIPIRNLDLLIKTAAEDSIFAGRLRRLARSPRYAQIDVADLRSSLRRFGLAHRFLDGDELVFERSRRWRWPFLALLEDGLVESPGSGRLYQSNSQRVWERHQVTGIRKIDDVVTALCGVDWGPFASAIIANEIEEAIATYHVGSEEDPIEVLPELVNDVVVLVARAEDRTDQLPIQPECPRRA